ncbi:MAG: hypothetical protein ACKVOD_10640, partial [Flavobacterium sp.]
MKLKLLFFMGILSVLFNTVNGQNTAPVFQVPPSNRLICPGYVAANTQFQVTDANTPAANLVTTASAVGGQNVTFNFTQDPTGILRSIDVTPVGPIVPGIVTVTIQLSDVGAPTPNLSTNAVFTINFNDSTDPVISTTLPLPNIIKNISSGAGCKFTIPDYRSLVSATDDCGGVVITQSPAAGSELSVANNDVVTITITATDDYGNDVSTSFDVTLKDVTNPVFTSSPTDSNVNVNSLDCTFTIPDYVVLSSATDNCGTSTITQSPLLGTVLSNHNTTQLITLTADDGNGNTATSTFTITLKDVTDPVFTSTPADANVNLDADCEFSIPDYVVLASATDNCGTPTITQSPAAGSIVSGHNTTQLITLTVDDTNGNTATSTFTITLKDVTDPTITTVSDFDVDINSTNCDFTIPDYTGLVTTFDNCGAVTVTQSPASGTLSGHNTTQIITLTADDGNGNTATSTFTITLKDVTKPTITPSGDEEVSNDPGQCGALVTVSATATDNCTSPISPMGVRSDALDLSAAYPVGITTITWNVSDDNGNSAIPTTQTVTVTDDQAPVFASAFPDLTVNNDPGFCSYATNQLPVPSV